MILTSFIYFGCNCTNKKSTSKSFSVLQYFQNCMDYRGKEIKFKAFGIEN